MEKQRCDWCLKDDIYMDYHDMEWGIPIYDGEKLFELLNLEGAQAGLSWYTVLVKREGYKKAFFNWDIERIAKMTEKEMEKRREDPGIIRNRLKIKAVVTNAQLFLEMKKEGISFSNFLWDFAGGKPIVNHWKSMSEIPATTPESDAMSKALKKRGFKFVGTTIVYAFMQAAGMVDDHLPHCWKRK